MIDGVDLNENFPVQLLDVSIKSAGRELRVNPIVSVNDMLDIRRVCPADIGVRDFLSKLLPLVVCPLCQKPLHKIPELHESGIFGGLAKISVHAQFRHLLAVPRGVRS